MDLTKEQESVLLLSIQENCTRCLNLSRGICKGDSCIYFNLKQQLDDSVNGEKKRREKQITELSTELNTVRTKLTKYKDELAQYKAQKEILNKEIQRVTNNLYKNNQRYKAIQKDLDLLKSGKSIEQCEQIKVKSERAKVKHEYNKFQTKGLTPEQAIAHLEELLTVCTDEREKRQLNHCLWNQKQKLKNN